MTEITSTTTLGKTGIRISHLGLGAWAWGDRLMWDYGRGYQDDDIKAAFEVSLEAGVNFIDTAEAYGRGRSERILGSLLPGAKTPIVVATKFMPFPWRWSKKSFMGALRHSLERLKIASIDLYQIHWPWPPAPVETWADALGDAVEQGLVKAVGVSNYDEAQMRRAYATLAKRGIPLASNQMEYHLLNRKWELNGLLQACQELSITFIAYSPLGQGSLTGKYTPDKPLPGLRGRRYSRSYLEKTQPLIRLMREIGREHDGKSPAQVALNWCICKGAVPIPGAKIERQAQENAGALGWQLSGAEVAALDETSAKILGG